MEEYLQYWLVLKRRWLPVSLIFGAILALSIVRTLRETPSYQATGQLVFKRNATSSLTGIGNQLGQLDGSLTGKPLGNELAILRSQPLAERTTNILRLNLNPQLLLRSLEVKNIDGTDIVEVAYTDIDPRRAAEIVNTTMKLYIQNDINANRSQTKSPREFLSRQLPVRKAALQAAELKLQDFKQINKALDLKSEASSTVAAVNDFERQIGTIRTELASQTARIESIKRLFGVSAQKAIVTTFIAESPGVSLIMQQLQDARQKLEFARLRLTDDNPTVITLKEQEAILQKELKQRIEKSFVGQVGRLNQATSPDEISQLNPGGLQYSLLTNYANAEAERLVSQARLNALGNLMASYKQRASNLPQLESQQRQLEREIAATEFGYQNLLARYQELQVAENLQVSNAVIMTPALIPGGLIKGRQYINILQGVIGGLLLGAGTAFILENIDKTIKTTQSVKDLLGYTLLGSIPPFTNGNFIPELIVKKQPESAVSEAFRMLQTNLRFFNSEQLIKVIVISSSVPREGKSTISANLALSISQLGRKVLLVDGDLRNPSQHQIWEIPNDFGLSNVLKGELDLEKAVHEVMPNLQVLTSGELNHNPAMLLDSSQMAIFVGQVAQRYDFAIIDSPPLTVAADATILGKIANGILLVVRPGIVDSNSVIQAKELLEKADQNVLGVAINGIKVNQQYSNYKLTNV